MTPSSEIGSIQETAITPRVAARTLIRRRRRRRAQAGQSLIIAIAVLFLLAFLAALFITLLQRNLERTARSSNIITADFYAQAGIRYADQMLTTSPQGADWRPQMKYYLGDAYAKLTPDPNTATPAAGTTFAFDTTGNNVITLSAEEQAAYLAYVNSSYSAATSAPPKLIPINPRDPDAFWLKQGFARYAAQGGRYLIRLTYGTTSTTNGTTTTVSTTDPYEQDNALTGKYIRIEAVGRTGVVDDTNPADPTVFSAQPTRLNATLIAYKPIGLTDYARFITNRDQRSDTMNLGVPSRYFDDTANAGATDSSIVTPGVMDFTSTDGGNTFALTQYPLVTTYGALVDTSNNPTVQGGSLRCNGNLRLYGMNVAFLNQAEGDDWEIAGNLTFDGYQASTPATDPSAFHVVKNTLTATDVFDATPSNATAYDTLTGLIRDGGSGSDAAGYARNIQRLNPPTMDLPTPGTAIGTTGGTTDVPHYSALTNQGTEAAGVEGAGPYSKESLGGPATVYIDNTSDNQPESSSAQVGSTLRDDWLNPQKNINGYWHGPFYDPPGATVVFGPQYLTLSDGTIKPRWGFTVTRSDTPAGLGSQAHVTWRWNGEKSTDTPVTAATCTFVYGAPPTNNFVFDPTNPVYFIGADQVPQGYDPGTKAQNVDNDIVIYAEGNIRVRGVVSPVGPTNTGTTTEPAIKDPAGNGNVDAEPHHVTLVTNQIAYIEGSLLKGGLIAQNTAQASSIAVLARRYVTLNTSQFLAGAVQHNSLGQIQTDEAAGGPNTSGALDFGADSSLAESFDDPAPYTATPTNAPDGSKFAATQLYVSQYASGGGGASNSAGLLSVVDLAFDGTQPTNPQTLDGSDSVQSGSPPTLVGSPGVPNRLIVDLNNLATPASGYDAYSMTFSKSPTSVSDYELAKAAVLPSDVHIEALLYAQDNSFFVIPGDWFNDDATDTMTAYQTAVTANGTTQNDRSRPMPTGTTTGTLPQGTATGGATDPLFPMYGQPVDMKIVIDGSVSENVPADISDQAAWMQRWGWIPKYHGTPPVGNSQAEVGSPHPQLPTAALEAGTGNTSTNQIPDTVAKYVPPPGLTFIYDPSETTLKTYARLDQYGRPLPFAPNLPVSPDLLYSGQTTGNSLVQ